MEVGSPGPTAAAYGFAHLEPYLSVSRKVGWRMQYEGGNQKLDVMLVQYFLLTLGTRVNPGEGDEYVDQFFALQARNNGFAIDGKFGDMTRDAIMLYQSYAASSPYPGAGTITGKEMKLDLVVHPGPNKNQGLPLTAEGKIYTIAHMNERFKVLHPEFSMYIRRDATAPRALRDKVEELLPMPTPVVGQSSAAVMAVPSFHIARARHFSPRH